MKSSTDPDYVVGVAGCGAMGQGIAQVSVQGGMRTLLFDARDGGAEAAKTAIAGRLNRLVEKGRMGETDAQAAIDLLVPATGLADMAEADCVVEAVFEDLDVKHALFRELESVVRSDCILASNTSSIPLAQIARVCEHRDRVAGLHFFNPVPLMKLVEVIRAAQTSDETVAVLMDLGERMTRVPVEVKDSPGFLVNMGGRAYTTEALRIVHEGVATPEQVDAVMRDCWGFRMGPFELMDLTGIDVNYPVSQIIYDGYNQDPRLKTSPNHKAMFDAGLFGRKTGQGWYKYDGKGQKIDPPSADFVTDAAPITNVAVVTELSDMMGGDWLEDAIHDDELDLELVEDMLLDGVPVDPLLQKFLDDCGMTIIEDDGSCPVLAAPVGGDASLVSSSMEDTTRRLVCLDLQGDTSGRVTLMTGPGSDPGILNGVAAAISAAGCKVTAIKDGAGFVGQRMTAMVANLGCYMAEIGLATPEDIDKAMQLGLNYPQGSIALGEQIGAELVHRVLCQLQDATGEDRYRPTQWLRRRADLGLPLHTPN